MNSYDAFSLTYKTGVSNLELEEIISQDSSYSFYYAKDILQTRFEIGEWAISEDCHYSWSYAKNVLKSRFRLGEKAIVKYINFNSSCEYFIKVMGYDHE